MDFIFREWQVMWTPELKKREIDIPLERSVRKIVTLTGSRRCGKTYS